MVNYTHLARKLACMFSTYRSCNPMVGVSEYKYNKNLLGGVTNFGATLGLM